MSATTGHGVKVRMATLATVQANVMDSIHDSVPTFLRLGSVSCFETVWNWGWKDFEKISSPRMSRMILQPLGQIFGILCVVS